MKKVYVILLSLMISISIATKIKKKSLKPIEATTPQPAIIAIEIVDPNENSTSKNSKRTIDNALGYGYNSYEKPRYEVYKYSQHDIPGYKGNQKLYHSSEHTPTIQKSVQYTLPTITEYKTNSQQALKPGTTLYSSLTSRGQLGGLKSSISQIPELQHNSNPVPVILLRIYPDQLHDSTIHANLPDGHPFAKVINSVNIQSLLNHYVKALKVNSGQDYSSQKYVQQYPEQNDSSQKYVQQYPEQNNYYQQQQYQDYAPVNYQYQQISHQSSTQKPQYYYVPAAPSQTAEQESHQQYYQQDYDDYYSGQAEDQQQKLLTEENYPSNKHTRVIFKTNSGKIRTPESEESSRNPEVKTINIHVPENVAKVEVQESERPYYDYQQNYQQQPEVYVTPPTKNQHQQQENYYNNQEEPSYDYQNIGYDEMAKYLARRGVLNNYYYQGEDQKSTDQMVAAYEEGFPSTTVAPRIRKVKTKKRSKSTYSESVN